MQSKLCLGQVDAGHGMTPFMTYTGQRGNGGNTQSMPVINSGTSFAPPSEAVNIKIC